MIKIKKLLCALTAAAVTSAAMLIPPVLANVSEQDEKVDFLINIGIMNPITDEQIQLVDTVKRKDFAVLLTRMLNGGRDAENSGKCEFVDVDINDAATADIVYAYEHNILNGYGEGIFRPEVAVKYEEAVKCLVCVLGYNAEAEIEGGFPNGYMQTAARLEMLDGISAQSGEFIGLKDLAALIYNSLDIPYMTVKYSRGQMQYVKSEDSTVLSESFDMYDDKGIITANSRTSLDGGAAAANGYVIIDGEMYAAGKTNAEELIGQYVKFYYTNPKNSDEKTLTVVTAYTSKNNVLKISGDDITDVYLAAGNGNSEIKYAQNGGRKVLSAKISPKADVLRNGVVCFEYDSKMFMPDTGAVTLIDNNGDGIYEVVSVESTDTYTVKNASAYFGKVTDFYDDTKTLTADENDGGNVIKIIKPDGENGTFADIKAWDILSVCEAQTETGKYAEIKISRNVVTGRLTSVSADSVSIDGTEYKLNNTFKEYIEKKLVSLQTGVTQDFCLDVYGRLAAIKEGKAGGKYYYIKNVSKSDNGEDTIISAWNISADEWENYELNGNKKISVNDSSKKPEDIKALEKSFVRLIKNSSGNISKIYSCEAEFGSDKNLQRCSGVSAYMDYSTGGEIGYYPNENTVAVTIPQSDEYANDKTKYVKRISNFGDTKYKYVQLYDVEDYIPAIIVHRSDVVTGSENVGMEKPSMIVTDISEELYDDDTFIKISGYSSSGETSYLLNEDTVESESYKKLNIGDFVRVETDLNGIGTALAIDYSVSENKVTVGKTPYNYGSSFTDLNIFCGKITEINQAANIVRIEHSYGEDTPTSAVTVMKMPSVVLINDSQRSSDRRFELSDGSALQTGQFVVIRRRAGRNQIAEVFAD